MSHTIQSHFSSINDKRQAGKVEHSLIDIIILCIRGVVAGADDCSDIEEFGLESIGMAENDTFSLNVHKLNTVNWKKTPFTLYSSGASHPRFTLCG